MKMKNALWSECRCRTSLGTNTHKHFYLHFTHLILFGRQWQTWVPIAAMFHVSSEVIKCKLQDIWSRCLWRGRAEGRGCNYLIKRLITLLWMGRRDTGQWCGRPVSPETRLVTPGIERSCVQVQWSNKGENGFFWWGRNISMIRQLISSHTQPAGFQLIKLTKKGQNSSQLHK